MTAKDGGEPPRPLEGLEEANPDYMGFSHEQLVAMVSAIDPGQVEDISRVWVKLGEHFETFSKDLGAAIEATKSEWTGAAGDEARDYTDRLGKWFGDAGQHAVRGGVGVSGQSAAGSHTKSAMPEPIQFSMDDAISTMATGGPFDWAVNAAEVQQKFEEKQLRHQEAARLVEMYDRELYATARTMPDLGRPPMMSSGGGGTEPPPPLPPRRPGERRTLPPEIGGDDRGVDTRTGDNGADQTTRQQTVITPPEQKPPVPPQPPRPPVVPPPVQPPVVPPPVGLPGRDSGGAGRGGVGAGRGPGGTGGGPGGRGAGGPGSGFGPRGTGGPGGAGVPGAGARGGPGAGMGPLGAQGAPGRAGGPAGAAGRGGAGGMPMGAAGRGQGGEDGEHKRPDYLIEPEPDEVFGTDEMTAPPVIGE